MNWKGLTSTFWAVDKITSFSDKDIDCITNTPLSNLRNLESNGINLHNAKKVQNFLSWTLTIHGTAQGKGGDHLYSSLPFPLAHEDLDIYLHLCMWDDYTIFLIASLVTIRLLFDEIYHFGELLFDRLMKKR